MQFEKLWRFNNIFLDKFHVVSSKKKIFLGHIPDLK